MSTYGRVSVVSVMLDHFCLPRSSAYYQNDQCGYSDSSNDNNSENYQVLHSENGRALATDDALSTNRTIAYITSRFGVFKQAA